MFYNALTISRRRPERSIWKGTPNYGKQNREEREEVDRGFGRVYEDTGKGTIAQTLPSFTLTVLALDRNTGCLRCSTDNRELRNIVLHVS
jgi:hypothetical protein